MKKIKIGKTLLLTCIVAMGIYVTSCSNDNDNVNDNVNPNPNVNWTEPTTDQMSIRVTADLQAASLSQFTDKSTGAAFLKRLPKVTTTITDDTGLVLLKGSDINSLSDEVITNMAQVLGNEGYIVIETPTSGQLDIFYDKLDNAIEKLVTANVEELFDLTPEQLQASVRSSMAGRMEVRRNNLQAYTRGAADDEACAELIIFGPTDYYYEEPLRSGDVATISYSDTDGTPLDDTPQDITMSWEPTEYHYGLIADGAAQWINSVEDEYDQQWSAGGYGTRGAHPVRRADGSQSINDIMSATETFTFSGKMYFQKVNSELYTLDNRVKMIIRCWGVHNMVSGLDYYYVSQNVELRMGYSNGLDPFYTRYYSPQDWMPEITKGTKDKPSGNFWYGNFLTDYETSMDLEGKGTISCEAATPETANQVSTQNVNTTSSSSQTGTIGTSLSRTAGLQGGKLRVDGTFTVSSSLGVTVGSSFAMGNSKSIKDLSVVKNTAGTKVAWTYTGRTPKAYGQGNQMHEQPAEILVNDADLENDACWSVKNPKGQYKVKIESCPTTGVLVREPNGKVTLKKVKAKEDNTWEHTLLQPNRALQTWRMMVLVTEWQDGFDANSQDELTKAIARKFPDLYQSNFTVGELEPGSMQAATSIIQYSKLVFDNYKDILQSLGRSYGVKKYVIYWSSDSNIKTKDGYVVTINN